MQCPLCGSDITSGATYCPICGADVEAARRRAQGAGAPTQQMPRQTQAMPRPQARPQQPAPQVPPQPRRAAVPMNSSLPPQQAQNLRTFDTKSMSSTPKWPIVLIVVLALVIIAAVVLIVLNLTKQPTTTVQQPFTPVASSVADASATSDQAATTPEAQPTAEPAADQPAQPATTGASTDEQAYATLQAVYDELGSLDGRISSVAGDFNSYYASDDMSVRQQCLADAQGVQGDVNAQISALDAVTLAEGSQYAGTLETLKTLANDLKMRIDVLVEGWQNSVNGLSVAEITEPVGRYNGSDGISTYKADFDANYASAAPAAPAA